MAKYVANEHGEWIEVEGDTFTFYVLDTEDPKVKEAVDSGDLVIVTGRDIQTYGREVAVKV